MREGNSNSSWAEEDWEWIAAASFPKFRDFEFKFKGWSCVLTTWRDFEAAALASYRDRLDQFREDAERAAVEDLRLVRTKSKRNADHYYWLARNLVPVFCVVPVYSRAAATLPLRKWRRTRVCGQFQH